MTFAKPAKSLADEIPHTPVAKRYDCAAHNCPMVGSIFESGSQGAGICAYHFGANPTDWPRISQALHDWACVTDEIRECRRAHTDAATALNPGELQRLFAQAQARVEPLVGTWWDQLKPQAHGRHNTPDTYRSWGQRLESFIGSKVVAEMTRRRAA